MPPVRSKVSKRRRRQNRGYISPSRGHGYRRQQTPQGEYTPGGQDLHTAMEIDDVVDTNTVVPATSPRGPLSGRGVLIILPPVHENEEINSFESCSLSKK